MWGHSLISIYLLKTMKMQKNGPFEKHNAYGISLAKSLGLTLYITAEFRRSTQLALHLLLPVIKYFWWHWKIQLHEQKCSPCWEEISWAFCPGPHSEWELQALPPLQQEVPKSLVPVAVGENVYIETQTPTHVLQNSSPRVKPGHVNKNKEEVEECGDDHEEWQLPD